MVNHISNFDIIIVGASIAGCTAALLYAQKSIKVLLIDKIKSDESYKIEGYELEEYHTEEEAIEWHRKIAEDIEEEGKKLAAIEIKRRNIASEEEFNNFFFKRKIKSFL